MPRQIAARIVLLTTIAAMSAAGALQGAQDSTLARGIDGARLGLVSGLTAGGFVYGHILQSDLWWKGQRSSFHFDWDRDWSYALGADKLGHFFFPYLVTNLYRQAFSWAGLDSRSSLIAASTLALSYQTYVEIRDGFSAEWGFSWGDFAADVLGAAYPILQDDLPALRIASFKVSFNPSERFKAGSNASIIDDYESITHWLSLNVHGMLPDHLRDWYPPWLNLAVGHSVGGLDFEGGGFHKIILSLDWNLEGLPGDGWLWNLLRKNLNYYHLPAPAVQILPNVVWYGLRI